MHYYRPLPALSKNVQPIYVIIIPFWQSMLSLIMTYYTLIFFMASNNSLARHLVKSHTW